MQIRETSTDTEVAEAIRLFREAIGDWQVTRDVSVRFVVAVDRGEIIGAAEFSKDVVDEPNVRLRYRGAIADQFRDEVYSLNHVAVIRGRRGEGIATRLVSEVIATVASEGGKYLLGVMYEPATATPFYRRLGFHVSERGDPLQLVLETTTKPRRIGLMLRDDSMRWFAKSLDANTPTPCAPKLRKPAPPAPSVQRPEHDEPAPERESSFLRRLRRAMPWLRGDQ